MVDENNNSFKNGGTSYMNDYRTANRESDYRETLKSMNGNEHLNTTRRYDGKVITKNVKESLTISESDINKMMGSDIFTPTDSMLENRFNLFSRYGYLDPTNELVSGTREYLFFSKPDLHIIDTAHIESLYAPLANSPFFQEAFARYKQSCYSLQQTFPAVSTKTYVTPDGIKILLGNKYMPILSNHVTSTLDLPEITAGEVQNNQNLYQMNTSYREGSIISDNMYDFSLEFKDNKYLDVYMIFKIYDEYIRMKYETTIYPTKMAYIFNKIYPEALSIWKVIVDDTGRIMYWAKAIGCTPMSVPRSTMSNIEGNIKFTINWKAQFVNEMDPVNLVELNYLTASSLGIRFDKLTEAVINNKKKLATNKIRIEGDDASSPYRSYNGSTWVGLPFVIVSGDGYPNSKQIRSGNPYRSGHTPSDSQLGKTSFHRLVWVDY